MAAKCKLKTSTPEKAKASAFLEAIMWANECQWQQCGVPKYNTMGYRISKVNHIKVTPKVCKIKLHARDQMNATNKNNLEKANEGVSHQIVMKYA